MCVRNHPIRPRPGSKWRRLAVALRRAAVRPPTPHPEELHAICAHRDEFVVALPEDSPLAAYKTLAAQQLRDARFAVPEQEFGTLHAFLQHAHRASVT